MALQTAPIALLLLALLLAACAREVETPPPQGSDAALAFALGYEPAPPDWPTDAVVEALPSPDPAAEAALERRPITPAVRRAVAIIGTRLYRTHVEHYGQSYEIRDSSAKALLDVFAELTGMDLEKPEFLPSRAIYEWAMTQEDLASDPLIQGETKRIEKALARDR